jgi:hypothetical protein
MVIWHLSQDWVSCGPTNKSGVLSDHCSGPNLRDEVALFRLVMTYSQRARRDLSNNVPCVHFDSVSQGQHFWAKSTTGSKSGSKSNFDLHIFQEILKK